MSFIELILRIIKGTPLTDLELDDNFRKIKTAINYLLGKDAAASIGLNIVGEIKLFGGATLPTGYLWCNGAAVSRTTYADLFAITGTKFGVGNGTTTFNLPDFRAAVPMGSNPMGGSTKGSLANRTDGAIVGAQTADASHTHTASGTLDIDTLSYTPSGTINVVAYSGNVTPTISTTVNPVVLDGTPSGAVVSTTLLNIAVPTININGEACSTINDGAEPTTVDVMDCVTLTIDTNDVINAINPDTNSIFTGDDLDLGHAHTAVSTSSAISLNHNHAATFSGTNVDLAPEGTADITVNSATLAVSTIQPSQICNFIIKY